jgi:cytochrome b561
MTERTGYSLTQIALHWVTAILILAAWWYSEGMGDALDARLESGATGITGNTLHVWLGGATFLVILIRIAVRLMQGAPEAVPGTSPLMAKAGEWGHRLLYLLMITTPLLGAITWYLSYDGTGDLHTYSANALMIVALGHAAMGLWHHYGVKDDTLRRMMRPE